MKDDLVLTKDNSQANARIPRPARFDTGFRDALVFILFFFMLWLVPVGFRASDVNKFYVLRQRGAAVVGEVKKSYTGRGSVGVVYKFSVGGVDYTGQAKMIADDYRVQSPGDQISIKYLPDNPSVNQPSNWKWFSVWETPYYLLGLGLLGGIGTLLVAGLRKRELERTGFVVEGRVTGCTAYRNQFKLYYEFTTENKSFIEGSSVTVDECEVGMSIPVVYIRSNPKRNDIYLG